LSRGPSARCSSGRVRLLCYSPIHNTACMPLKRSPCPFTLIERQNMRCHTPSSHVQLAGSCSHGCYDAP
jgi:hypothetical protein